MQMLLVNAAMLGERLRARSETLAVGESSSGGLIAASLLAQAGASAFFLGGAVLYTGQAREGLLGITPADMQGVRPSTEAYALLVARRLRERLGATWGLAESGAAGPAGNRYGDASGHSCFAISGPIEDVLTIETGSVDRLANMRAFASEALMWLHGKL
jgi:nicotinamide-nucleotide amidase